MKKHQESIRFCLALTALLTALLLAACGDDDDFSPIARDHDYDEESSSLDDEDMSSSSRYSSSSLRQSSANSSSSSSHYKSSSSCSIFSKNYSSSYARNATFDRKDHYPVKWPENRDGFLNPNIEYGTMTDPRDGKTYKTVEFHGQTWMAQNLDFADSALYPLLKGKSVCYNNDESNCDLYGRLYSRMAAMNDSTCDFRMWCDLGSDPIQGICPDGWHIPTRLEMEDLAYLEGRSAQWLMSEYGWIDDSIAVLPGTNTYGLSFVGTGYRWGTTFDSHGMYGFMWHSGQNDEQNYLVIQGQENHLLIHDYDGAEVFISVRCIKGDGIILPPDDPRLMSSSSQGFDWSLSKETFLNPEIEYDTIIDSRDGKVYKTVKIGEQTWMAENLNYDPGLGGSGDAKYEWSWCYDNEPKNCDVAGRLYTWAAAIDSIKMANDADDPRNCGMGKGSFGCTFWTAVQGVCPDGWHLPSTREWNNLNAAIGVTGEELKSQTGWYNDGDGTNVTGFSAIPAGWYRNGVFGNAGIITYFWGSYGSYDDEAEYMRLFSHSSREVYYLEKDHGFSVRCLKDEVLPASSSSSLKSSSSVNSSSSVSNSSRTKQDIEPFLENAGDQFNPDIDYGTLIDERDGKTYKTVEVGNAVWMAENLNYAGNEIGESVCFNDDDSFCELYGRFYSRDAAMNSSRCAFKSSCSLGSDPIQGICPDGWHIPTKKEAQDLVNLASGTSRSLRSAEGWKAGITPGTDKYGLSFLGAGSYNADDGFYSLGEYEHVWVYYVSSVQYYIVIRGAKNEAEIWDFGDDEVYNPVRCVKDE
jgi:uncharacterized protein (TIGR02145 family)